MLSDPFTVPDAPYNGMDPWNTPRTEASDEQPPRTEASDEQPPRTNAPGGQPPCTETPDDQWETVRLCQDAYL